MKTQNEIINEIQNAQCSLGIEFGSTRIKAVLVDSLHESIAGGFYEWENSLENGFWTYSLDAIKTGLKSCYASLKKDVQEKFGVKLQNLKAMGISAMMHGYIALDCDGNFLVPFRTWRNTTTGDASKKLSDLFNFPVPERWTISHLYQAILNDEPHVKKIARLCTLASYIQLLLTGQNNIGLDDASGMFPVDSETKNYSEKFLSKFEELIAPYKAKNSVQWTTKNLLPKIFSAGEKAGTLTKEGAKFLDEEGDLQEGILLCPPEGDAGTGMVATNSVKARTGNISAGTSVFAMVVLEKSLASSYPGIIDIVATPDGNSVAMVHANNCTGEINNWIYLFYDVIEKMGLSVPKGKLFDTLIDSSINADKDCGKLLAYNYISGETITGFSSGRPLFVRGENANFTVENFMRAQMFACLGALRKGMDVLSETEKVQIDSMTGAGGYFKTLTGLKYTASALKTKVSVMETAGEGGPWGMAILASYAADNCGKNLGDFLEEKVFASCKKTSVESESALEESFNIFYRNYLNGLKIEKSAVENI